MNWPGCSLIGSGEADSPQMDLFEARIRATIRYADPAAWTTATAVARALSGRADLSGPIAHEIGIVVVSDCGAAETMNVVAAAAVEGFSSPLRYPAASPGSLAGVACIAFGFRGPTLNLTMLPHQGIPVALQISAGWLSRGIARHILVAAVLRRESTSIRARAVLLAPPGGAEICCPTGQSLEKWLADAG